jgi:hypothetical protein
MEQRDRATSRVTAGLDQRDELRDRGAVAVERARDERVRVGAELAQSRCSPLRSRAGRR